MQTRAAARTRMRIRIRAKAGASEAGARTRSRERTQTRTRRDLKTKTCPSRKSGESARRQKKPNYSANCRTSNRERSMNEGRKARFQ